MVSLITDIYNTLNQHIKRNIKTGKLEVEEANFEDVGGALNDDVVIPVQTELSEANETIDANLGTIEGLESDLSDANETIQTHLDTIDAKDLTISGLNDTIDAKNLTISGLESDLSECQADLASCEGEGE